MLDPRTLQALQNYLGTTLGGILTPEQMATVNTLVQNAPQDPTLQAAGVVADPGASSLPGSTSINPATGQPYTFEDMNPTMAPPPGEVPQGKRDPTSGPTGIMSPGPASPYAPPPNPAAPITDPTDRNFIVEPQPVNPNPRQLPETPPINGGLEHFPTIVDNSGGGSASGRGVGSTIGFNGQGVISGGTPGAQSAGGVPTDSSGHVTGSGSGYAGAGQGNNRFLPNGQIQLAWDDPDADRLIAAHPGQYVKQVKPGTTATSGTSGTSTGQASSGQQVGTISQSQQDYINQQNAATAAANAKAAGKPAAAPAGTPAPTAGASNVGQASAGQQVGTISQSQQDYIKQQIAATAAANAGKSTGMARGGVIREPVEGMGMRTGKTYEFGERGPETVTPGAAGTQAAPPMQPPMAPQAGMQPSMPPPRPSVRILGPGGRMFGGQPPMAAAAGATGKPPPKGDPMARPQPI